MTNSAKSLFGALTFVAISLVVASGVSYWVGRLHTPDHAVQTHQPAAVCCGPCCRCVQPCCCEPPARPAQCCEPPRAAPKGTAPEPQPIKPLDGPDSIELADTVTLTLPDGSTLNGTVIKVEPAARPDPPKSMIAIEAELKRMRDAALKAKPLPKE